MRPRTIALVGDFSEKHAAHRAIPRALALARALLDVDVAWEWVASRELRDSPGALARFSAVWLVPASPYESTDGALRAVQWAREGGHPFFGTCGGFQHALLEFARDVAGLPAAVHAESDPHGSDLLLTRLACPLGEVPSRVHFAKGSLFAGAYGAEDAMEGYHCSFGFNTVYRPALEAAGLRFTSWDDAGDVRGAELPAHPFFAGVLFQPERAALAGRVPPLVTAFIGAVGKT